MLLPRGIRACVGRIDGFMGNDFTFQSKEARTLFVTFAGMTGIRKTLSSLKQTLGFESSHSFEFVKSLQEKDCDALFLRDRQRAYYHYGIRGIGDNIDEAATFLTEFIRKRNYGLVVTLGHSMGGYASILFASKISADICISIAAPSFLDSTNRAAYKDDRYAYEKNKLEGANGVHGAYLDLQDYLLSAANNSCANRACRYFLFYGENDRLDRIHARRMMHLSPLIRVYEIAGADHINTARSMRTSGVLPRLFDRILSMDDRTEVDDALTKSMEAEHSIREALPSSDRT
jgi:pimeloyl-ACP methyl ester carboxylesterase